MQTAPFRIDAGRHGIHLRAGKATDPLGGPLQAVVCDNDTARLLAQAPAMRAAVASRSHRSPETDAFLAANGISECVSAGSSLKFCLVATGEADIYPRFGPTMEWDTAAGQAVLEAAGGAVLMPDGTPFRYGKAGLRNGDFIAVGDPAQALVL